MGNNIFFYLARIIIKFYHYSYRPIGNKNIRNVFACVLKINYTLCRDSIHVKEGYFINSVGKAMFNFLL